MAKAGDGQGIQNAPRPYRRDFLGECVERPAIYLYTGRDRGNAETWATSAAIRRRGDKNGTMNRQELYIKRRTICLVINLFDKRQFSV